MTYTYILAPRTANNITVFKQACDNNPDLTFEKRVALAYKKSSNDVFDGEGNILTPLGEVYLYVKVTTSEFSEDMLAHVTDYQLFNRETQPFTEYWLNMK